MCTDSTTSSSTATGPRPRSRTRVRTARSALAALTVVAVAGCGSSGGSLDAQEGALTGERVLSPGGTTYDEVRLTWAQGGTLHYGDRTLDTGATSIRGIAAASSGWFLEVADSPSLDEKPSWVFFDGERTTPLGERVDFVATSADGRWAGWIDRDGPERPGGQVARVVVVDLTTGRVVLDDSTGMGGEDEDTDVGDLYSELPPTFLGFDDTFAYWQAPAGRLRWSEATGVETAEKEVQGGAGPVQRGRPVDRYAGTAVAVQDGRVERLGFGGPSGALSPDGDTIVLTGGLGTSRVSDARTGRPVRLEIGHRFATFGAWVGEDLIALVATDRRLTGVDLSGDDPSRGFLTTCSLSTGACADEPVRGVFSVVFPGAQRDFYL